MSGGSGAVVHLSQCIFVCVKLTFTNRRRSIFLTHTVLAIHREEAVMVGLLGVLRHPLVGRLRDRFAHVHSVPGKLSLHFFFSIFRFALLDRLFAAGCF